MTVMAVIGGTPQYVLMDENRRIGPTVMPLLSGAEFSADYGFSGKRAYDKFCEGSRLTLRPYPLVEGNLRNQAAVPDDGLKLVVVDATGPHDPCLHAATIEAVLEAQANRTTSIRAEHRLLFDQSAKAYRMEESAS